MKKAQALLRLERDGAFLKKGQSVFITDTGGTTIVFLFCVFLLCGCMLLSIFMDSIEHGVVRRADNCTVVYNEAAYTKTSSPRLSVH